MRHGKAIWAEAIGTFGLVLVGPGAMVVEETYPGSVTHLGISIAFGVIVTAMILAFGRSSGAHINPAVTIGFWLTGKLEKGKLFPYIIAQLLGASVAGLVLKFFFPTNEFLGSTLPHCGVWQTVLLEIGLTFILMYVILFVSNGTMLWKKLAAYAIGFTVFAEAFLAGPLTGASMNPARSFGPAIASGEVAHLWIYFVAPIVGAWLAVVLCAVSKGDACCEGERCFSGVAVVK